MVPFDEYSRAIEYIVSPKFSYNFYSYSWYLINISEFEENGIISIISEQESEYLNNLPNMKEYEYFDKTFIDKYEIDKIE